jgi:predicted RNase H-like nuclease (RuvC/YqgF family)
LQLKSRSSFNAAQEDIDSKKSEISKQLADLHAMREEARAKEKQNSGYQPILKEISDLTRQIAEVHKTLDTLKANRDRTSQAAERVRREVRASIIAEADIV